MNLETCANAIELEDRSDLEQLEVHLQTRLSSRVRDLQIQLRDGCLVLRGYTRTYYAKQLAQHEVMNRTSLPIGANEIEVR
jgi:hypothetical protein